MRLQHLSPLVGQHDERTVRTANRNRPHEALTLEVLEVAGARIERLAVAVSKIAGGNDAERADRGQRAHLGAAQHDVMVAHEHTLTFEAARQIEVSREHLARVERRALARVRCAAATALAQLSRVTSLTGVIKETGIEVYESLLTMRGARTGVSPRCGCSWRSETRGASSDRTCERYEWPRRLAPVHQELRGSARCGRSWRLDTGNRLHLHHSGGILVWPLLWPLWRQNRRIGANDGKSSSTRCLALSADFHNYGDIRPAMHPGWRRGSFLEYVQYSRSSRLAGRLAALGASPSL